MNEHCCLCNSVCQHTQQYMTYCSLHSALLQGAPMYKSKSETNKHVGSDFNERCLQWVEGYKQSPEANKHQGSDFKDYMKEEKEWEAKHWRYQIAAHAFAALDIGAMTPDKTARYAVLYADALIAELEKTEESK